MGEQALSLFASRNRKFPSSSLVASYLRITEDSAMKGRLHKVVLPAVCTLPHYVPDIDQPDESYKLHRVVYFLSNVHASLETSCISSSTQPVQHNFCLP